MASKACLMVSKKLLTLFRADKLGPFILDDVPDSNTVSWVVSHFFSLFGVTLRLYMLVFFFFSPPFSLLLSCVDVSNLLKLYYKANRCLHVLVSSCHILNENFAFQCWCSILDTLDDSNLFIFIFYGIIATFVSKISS